MSPKSNPDGPNKTTRYHVTNKLLMRDGSLKSTWRYEQLALPRIKTAKLLVKVIVGKVEKSRKAFEESLNRVPIVQDVNIFPVYPVLFSDITDVNRIPSGDVAPGSQT